MIKLFEITGVRVRYIKNFKIPSVSLIQATTYFRLSKAIFCLLLCCAQLWVAAQQGDTLSRKKDSLQIQDTARRMMPVDSLSKAATPVTDRKIDSVVRVHSPRKAAIHSAILPGWGQMYNKKYWKLPLVYGALGTTAVVFKFNLDWYRRTRYAYTVLINEDTANYANVHPELQYSVQNGYASSLQNARDNYRRSVDYSVLFFILFWGLNVVDATVDAHLKAFDVSPDLSLKFKAGYSDVARLPGFGVVLNFK